MHYKRPSTRRSKHLHRSSSRRNKENGSRPGSFRNNKNNLNTNNENSVNAAAAAANLLQKRKVQRVSFEPSTSEETSIGICGSGGGTHTQTTTTIDNKPYPFDHSKSVDQVGVVASERRNSSQHEFNNRLSLDNDLLVHASVWTGSGGAVGNATEQNTPESNNTTATTHSKPPRI